MAAPLCERARAGLTALPRSRQRGLAVSVDDVDAHHERARATGARIVNPPVDHPYGLREYGARDPEDHRGWFGGPPR